mmetsp:Transcript_116618/g.277228  ORF Transcript_116618/g.277228 Transcript_116618/m.277228 type:complete len:243 (-) Transcript_116618:67-795(-)
METEIAIGCTLGSIAGYYVFRPQVWGAPPDGADGLRSKIEGSELWTFFISITLQAVVYPLLMTFAWYSWPKELPWLDSAGGLFQNESVSLFCLRLFLYMLFGFMMNDLPLSWNNIMFRLHHLLCLVGIIVILYCPEGGVPAAVGIVALEHGSAYYNSWVIDATMRSLQFSWWPKSSWITMVYYLGMTASNLAGSYCLLQVVLANGAHHTAFSFFFGIFGPPLIYLRQKEMFTNAKPAAAKQG